MGSLTVVGGGGRLVRDAVGAVGRVRERLELVAGRGLVRVHLLAEAQQVERGVRTDLVVDTCTSTTFITLQIKTTDPTEEPPPPPNSFPKKELNWNNHALFFKQVYKR